jgi:hypothetical protein
MPLSVHGACKLAFCRTNVQRTTAEQAPMGTNRGAHGCFLPRLIRRSALPYPRGHAFDGPLCLHWVLQLAGRWADKRSSMSSGQQQVNHVHVAENWRQHLRYSARPRAAAPTCLTCHMRRVRVSPAAAISGNSMPQDIKQRNYETLTACMLVDYSCQLRCAGKRMPRPEYSRRPGVISRSRIPLQGIVPMHRA